MSEIFMTETDTQTSRKICFRYFRNINFANCAVTLLLVELEGKIFHVDVTDVLSVRSH